MPVPTSRLVAVSVFLLALAAAGAASGQDAVPPTAAGALTAEGVIETEADELRIRLAPMTLQRLEALRDEYMAMMREEATALAGTLVEQMELRRAVPQDADAVAAADAGIAELMARKSELVSRANVILEAIEKKGGDVATARGYLQALDALHPEDVSAPIVADAEPAASSADDAVRARASELVALIRAQPPAHERAVPWAVPLAELQLELQPLPVNEIIVRLDKWQEILRREVRKRVRIDVLLNDEEKLEETLADLRASEGAAGAPRENVTLESIKAQLAEQSQAQQRIILAIVDRMELAIRLAEKRGAETKAYTSYIAAATGQKLNLTDLTVLRAQLLAWLKSPDGGVQIGLDILKFVVIVLAFWILSAILGRLTSAGVRRVPRSSSLLGPVLSGTVRRVTMFIGLVIGVSMLGVNIGPLLAMIGAAGLVIGLALQGTLSNFASGILILLNRPYDVGDVIDAGGVLGKVEAMNLVSTSILTFDNQLMLVPNNQIWNGVIKNVTGKTTRRVDLTFGIGYADDMDRAIEIIREAIGKHAKVHAEPAPTIRVHELGDNSVNIIARPWTRTADYWDVYWDLVHDVKRRFDEAGINIPFPQRDLHLPGPIEVKLALDGGRALAGAVSGGGGEDEG